MRDDFSESTKRTLAERVGWICSYPKCQQVTVGPHSNNARRINIGHACHIEAASPNGPRYNQLMTTEERKSIENGIWMCSNHSNLVDSDSSSFSVAQLKEWKLLAEKNALRALESGVKPQSKVDYYVSNILKHRELFSTIRDINHFSLYWCRKNHLYYLEGMGGMHISINDCYIYIDFLKEYCTPYSGAEYQYIGRFELPIWNLIDLVVSSHKYDETIHSFSVTYDFQKAYCNEVYISIGSETDEAHYGTTCYAIKNNELYDDLDRRISPTHESIFLSIINECRKIYTMIAP